MAKAGGGSSRGMAKVYRTAAATGVGNKPTKAVGAMLAKPMTVKKTRSAAAREKIRNTKTVYSGVGGDTRAEKAWARVERKAGRHVGASFSRLSASQKKKEIKASGTNREAKAKK